MTNQYGNVMNYASPPPLPPKRRIAPLFGWVLFIGLAIMLFMLLNTRNYGPFTTISIDDFVTRLDAGQIQSVVIGDNQLDGQFRSGQNINGNSVVNYRVMLPQGSTGTWPFMQWLLAHAGGATITADSFGGFWV